MKQTNQVGTIVGSSVHLTGTIKDSSDINIFGSVEGEVLSDEKVVIEDSATVKGPITAREVIVSGFVNGTIIAKDRIELNSSGSIKGNIDTKDLLIHSGASFIGESIMPEKTSLDGVSVDQEFNAEVEEEEEEEEKEEKEDTKKDEKNEKDKE